MHLARSLNLTSMHANAAADEDAQTHGAHGDSWTNVVPHPSETHSLYGTEGQACNCWQLSSAMSDVFARLLN